VKRKIMTVITVIILNRNKRPWTDAYHKDITEKHYSLNLQ